MHVACLLEKLNTWQEIKVGGVVFGTLMMAQVLSAHESLPSLC